MAGKRAEVDWLGHTVDLPVAKANQMESAAAKCSNQADPHLTLIGPI
jgi:hypothetical protein